MNEPIKWLFPDDDPESPEGRATLTRLVHHDRQCMNILTALSMALNTADAKTQAAVAGDYEKFIDTLLDVLAQNRHHEDVAITWARIVAAAVSTHSRLAAITTPDPPFSLN